MLVRSAANPSIIAYVKGRVGVKIKTADKPYKGEYGVGTVFTYAPHLWIPCRPDDAEALRMLARFEAPEPRLIR